MGAGKSHLGHDLEGGNSGVRRFFASTSEAEAPSGVVMQVERCLAQITRVHQMIQTGRPSFGSMSVVLRDLSDVVRNFLTDTRLQARLSISGAKGQSAANKVNGFPTWKLGAHKGSVSDIAMHDFSPDGGSPERSMQDLVRIMTNNLMDLQDILRKLFDTNPHESTPSDPEGYRETREEAEIVMRHHLRTCIVFENAVLDCYDRAFDEVFSSKKPGIRRKSTRFTSSSNDPVFNAIEIRKTNRPSSRKINTTEEQTIAGLVQFELSRVLDNSPAQLFWDVQFGKEVFAVTKRYFLHKLRGDHPDLCFDEIDALIDPSCDGVVSLSDFRSFLEYFGSYPTCLSNANALLDCVWFYGSLSTSSAELLLTNASPGSFLCRFCDQRPGRFTITYVELVSDHQGNGGLNAAEDRAIIHYHTNIDRELHVLLIEGDSISKSIKDLVQSYPISFRRPYKKPVTAKNSPAPKQINNSGSSPASSNQTDAEDADAVAEQMKRLFLSFRGRDNFRKELEAVRLIRERHQKKKARVGFSTPQQQPQPQAGIAFVSSSNLLLTPMCSRKQPSEDFIPAEVPTPHGAGEEEEGSDSENSSSASVLSDSSSFILVPLEGFRRPNEASPQGHNTQDDHDRARSPTSLEEIQPATHTPTSHPQSPAVNSTQPQMLRSLLEAAFDANPQPNLVDNDEEND